jgi:multisubunit Na+/H+ antiporter MnhC subunit
LNNRLLAGIALVIAGVLVLVFPEFLRIIVGVGLLIAGLWLALQNAPSGGGGSI